MLGLSGKDGETLPWLQRVQNFLPNGVHAVVVEAVLNSSGDVSLRQTYDLLITCHSLEGAERKRPELREPNSLSGAQAARFQGNWRLWGKARSVSWWRHAALLYLRSGEQGLPDPAWIEATLKVTEAVCCTGCRHCHLLEAGTRKHALEVSA